MKVHRRLLWAVLAAAAAFYACNKPGDEPDPIPPLTPEEGVYVRTLDADEKGRWEAIEYTAIMADGSLGTLSELVCLPESDPNLLGIACHITITSDDERPTNYRNLSIKTDIGVLARLMMGFNTFAVFPDYEGFGVTGDRSHPYLNREVSARQALAGAKAAMYWLINVKKRSMAAGWKSYAIGYSQGGAMAAGILRYCRENNLKGFRLAGALCGGGPYDPYTTLVQYIKDDQLAMPVAPLLFLKGFVDTDARMKALGCSYADFATQELMDSGIFDKIASKDCTTGQLDDWLNTHGGLCTASLCFRDGVIAYFKDGTVTGDVPEAKLKALENALKENALTYGGWMPEAGSREYLLFHSTRDNIVPFINYETVLAAWGQDRFIGYPYEDETYWSHQDAGAQFILLSVSLVQKYIL